MGTHFPPKRKKKSPREKTLTEQQIRFCTEYLKNGKNGKAAAIAAGYSEKNAAQQAYELLHFNEKIKDFCAQTVAEVSNAIAYGIKEATKELDESIQFAILTQNSMARMKGMELKLKLHGLLVERLDVRPAPALNFNILPFDYKPPSQIVDITPQEQLPAGNDQGDEDERTAD